MIESEKFGALPDGSIVTKYTICNSHNESVELLDFGASLHSIFVRDASGEIGNVILHAETASELISHSCEGSTIGRCANRIAYGAYIIDGIPYQLETNGRIHSLHSGSGNYAHRMFQAEAIPSLNIVRFSLHDKGEGGFGCSVDTTVSFSFDDNSRLRIQYRMVPFGSTVLCPTNHAYFHLAEGDAQDQILTLASSTIAPCGSSGVPEGEVRQICGTFYDFSEPRSIRAALEHDDSHHFFEQPKGYDVCYQLSKKGFGKAATLYSPVSGRKMSVFTDMPALILFTPQPPKGESRYPAVCLETQFVPNAVNCAQYDSPVFKCGEIFVSETDYTFAVS